MKTFVLKSAGLSLLSVLLFYRNSKSNVCKTFDDYYTDRDENENCYYNPEYQLGTPEIIQRQGYKMEIHHVTTEDGYILTLFRIPGSARGKPVFLQHGYASNSKMFVLTGEKSLAFVLANEGYDVWLGNSRGTKYSSNHTTLSTADEEYWSFGFDELGLYDLPAAFNYVGNLTKRKITYVGLSLGTVIMYIYSLTYPDEAYERVDMFVNLAPMAFVKEYGLGLRFTISNWNYIEPLLQALSKTKSPSSGIVAPLVKFACFPFPFQMRLCLLPIMLMFGFNYEQHDPETLPMVLLQTPESASLKIFTHGVQLAQSGMLARFNYGKESNMQIYGSSQPPFYDFSKMRVPTYIFRAKNDRVVTKENVDALYSALPEKVRPRDVFVVDDENFSHMDFAFGKNVVELVYNHLLDVLRNLPS